jgi:hypothetical protein
MKISKNIDRREACERLSQLVTQEKVNPGEKK